MGDLTPTAWLVLPELKRQLRGTRFDLVEELTKIPEVAHVFIFR